MTPDVVISHATVITVLGVLQTEACRCHELFDCFQLTAFAFQLLLAPMDAIKASSVTELPV